MLAAFSASAQSPEPAPTNASRLNVQFMVVNYNHELFGNISLPDLGPFTGPDLYTNKILAAGSLVLSRFQAQGFTNANVSVPLEGITNGVLTWYVYNGALPHVLISGRIFQPVSAEQLAALASPNQLTATNQNGPPTGSTNTLAGATHAPPGATNRPAASAKPAFVLTGYQVEGNTLLSDDTLESILSKYTGELQTREDLLTNIVKARNELQLEYWNRGFPTAKVLVPAGQSLEATNAIVRMQVIEGVLAEINVVGNRYFSSNNVMRALPSLKTNMILNSKVYDAELIRANGNQDRQIYTVLTNGPVSNTSALYLNVKDRLPLHAKTELNNQNSPGTPDLRLNSSAVYNNLWQLEHSLGVQYSISPEMYKPGNQWDWYDQPLVANYSGFYRMPLGQPESIAEVVEANPGSFGFNEATRQFNLPPPSGLPELNLYASRSTIDTGVEAGTLQSILDIPGVRTVTQQSFQEDLTVNETVGFRMSDPLPEVSGWRSIWSWGLDLKKYDLTSTKTNVFNFAEFTFDANGRPLPPIFSSVESPVPVTQRSIQYLPLALRYDGSMRDALGTTAFGLEMSYNLWHSGSLTNLRNITGSSQSHGRWVVLKPSVSRSFYYLGGWATTLRADGQWASEPLISNEQFGAGGVNSVRGYHEGEVFADTGWHVSFEEQTPPHVVGYVAGTEPLTIRASLYMDYAEALLLDPQGRQERTPLWGTGVGFVGSIGTHWESRFLFSLPLRDAGTIEKN
ncbi:MAG TPA: ShlB/FhaC/HecB family hemolysin secretion/activation protein, partial [Verrucomicrobiae bacterium]|nr:ShlB/FhaC/HecB family hemolysin secretion/activation protein [Verrucomicrobiae bacterium]